MIPRICTQIWVGPKPIPAREATWAKQLAAMNPDWKHRLHGNEALERFAADPYLRELQDRKESLAFVADRLRVLILREEGGIYIDADSQPVHPLSILDQYWNAPHVTFVSGYRNPLKPKVALHRGISFVDNTFFASAPGSRMINRIAQIWTPTRVVIDGHAFGIEVLMAQLPSDTVLLPHQYFYNDRATPETICLHDDHNLASWTKETQRKQQTVLITA